MENRTGKQATTKYDFYKFLVMITISISAIAVLFLEAGRGNPVAIGIASIAGFMILASAMFLFYRAVQKMTLDNIIAYSEANARENEGLIESMRGMAKVTGDVAKMVSTVGGRMPQLPQQQSYQLSSGYDFDPNLIAPKEDDKGGLIIDVSSGNSEFEN